MLFFFTPPFSQAFFAPFAKKAQGAGHGLTLGALFSAKSQTYCRFFREKARIVAERMIMAVINKNIMDLVYIDYFLMLIYSNYPIFLSLYLTFSGKKCENQNLIV
ncbi:MAG: hypothetical protein H7833_19205 [Magnetococcus sp. DMHC-1]